MGRPVSSRGWPSRHAGGLGWAGRTLIAAVVAIAVAALCLALGDRGRQRKAPIAAASPGPATARSTPDSAPWHTVPLPGELAMTIVGTAHDLYTASAYLYGPPGTSLRRLDPETGRLKAVTALADPADSFAPGQGQPVFAGGLLWVSSAIEAGGTVRLTGLDPDSLRELRDITLSFSGVTGGNQTAAMGANAGTIYVGAGDSYVAVDARTAHAGVRTRVQGGQLGALAVAPDDSRIYVGINDDVFYHGATETSYLQARTLDTGTLITALGDQAQPENNPHLGGIQSMLATDGGVWVSGQPGPHGEAVDFIPADLDFGKVVLPAGRTGGGGALSLSTFASGSVWVTGGNHAVSCDDPLTGATREVKVPDAMFTTVAYAGSWGFAVNIDTHAVVRLFAPAACSASAP